MKKSIFYLLMSIGWFVFAILTFSGSYTPSRWFSGVSFLIIAMVDFRIFLE